jgi:hypothetical protein
MCGPLSRLCVLQAKEIERLNGVYGQILDKAGVECIGELLAGGRRAGGGGFCLPKGPNATSAKHTLRSIAALPLLPCWSVCCLHARLLACTGTTFD